MATITQEKTSAVVAQSFHRRSDMLAALTTMPAVEIADFVKVRRHYTIVERQLEYRISSHFHPYVGELIKRLTEDSVRGLQDADTDEPELRETIFSPAAYAPTKAVKHEPVKELDFNPDGAYSVYNWELFFHVPLTVAIHLSKNQRYREAMLWFHFVFDPTDMSHGPTPERYWKVKPFRTTPVQMITDILVNLANPTDTALHQYTVDSIKAWEDAPFRPHVIARHRPSAYMFKAVFAYLDNVIAWGDELFRQDTRETINEALQLYVIAANLLGPKPQPVPTKGRTQPRSYKDLRGQWRDFGSVLVDIESDLPLDRAPMPAGNSNVAATATLRSLGRTLYFCVPHNDKLLGYWDTVGDRLFKIRNSLNIRGIFRQLPLFAPPIDPALLAKAAAAGLDVAAVVSGATQPLSPLRFPLLLQKATELCQEVKSLGANMLAAMEKEDGEALTVLRARHEKTVLSLAEAVRYGQWQEAGKNRESVERSIQNAAHRHAYYERLLGTPADQITLPEFGALDGDALDKLKLAAREPEVAQRTLAYDVVDAGGQHISSHEKHEMTMLEGAQWSQDSAVALDTIAGVVRLLPEIGINIQPFGIGGDIKIGGAAIAGALQIGAGIARGVGSRFSYEAGRAAKIGSYARREQEWAYQSTLAAAEITQQFKQLRVAQIREHVAEREWKNHKKQIEHAEDVERFLTDKKTNQGFYAWQKREAKGLHAACFDLAFEVAKKAERALQHDIGDTTPSYIQAGYLAGHEGLFAGEKLMLDLKRMELAYHELREREYELTKHVSLLQSAPEALIALRATGRCQVTLPEELFDFDGPGQYFRRLKSVAVSVPCVTGPYTSIGCRLTLLMSQIRRTPALADGYAPKDDDLRFSTEYGSLESIVTSSATNDSGLFEANLRDDRYVPFEGAGAISKWSIELPADVPQFDLDTIADVVLHVRYTAREGGDQLRGAAVGHLKTLLDDAAAAGSSRLLSVRHEFPNEWARFKSMAKTEGELSFELDERHYPYWSGGRLQQIHALELYARTNAAVTVSKPTEGEQEPPSDALAGQLGDLKVGPLTNVPVPPPVGPVTWRFSDNTMSDLLLVITWGKAKQE